MDTKAMIVSGVALVLIMVAAWSWFGTPTRTAVAVARNQAAERLSPSAYLPAGRAIVSPPTRSVFADTSAADLALFERVHFERLREAGWRPGTDRTGWHPTMSPDAADYIKPDDNRGARPAFTVLDETHAWEANGKSLAAALELDNERSKGATINWSPLAEVESVGPGSLLAPGVPDFNWPSELEIIEAQTAAEFAALDDRLELARAKCKRGMLQHAGVGWVYLAQVMRDSDAREVELHRRALAAGTRTTTEQFLAIPAAGPRRETPAQRRRSAKRFHQGKINAYGELVTA
jgi:hypothetical protein